MIYLYISIGIYLWAATSLFMTALDSETVFVSPKLLWVYLIFVLFWWTAPLFCRFKLERKPRVDFHRSNGGAN